MTTEQELKEKISGIRQELDRARGMLHKAHQREDPIIEKLVGTEARLVEQLKQLREETAPPSAA